MILNPSEPQLKWSDIATVQDNDGQTHNVFQRDTYACRVTFLDGFKVIVVLPSGSAQLPMDSYVGYVLDVAHKAYEATPPKVVIL